MEGVIGTFLFFGLVVAIIGIIAWRISIFISQKRNPTGGLNRAIYKCRQSEISNNITGQANAYSSPYPKATDKLGKSIQIILLISAVCSGIAAVIGLIGGFIDNTMWVWLGWGLSGVVVSLVAYWFVRTLSNIYLVLAEIRDNTKKQ